MQGALRIDQRAPLAQSAGVATFLLMLSCTDGFLKNTHGNFVFYILKDAALLALIFSAALWISARPQERPRGRWQGLGIWLLFMGYMVAQVFNPGSDITANIAGFRANALFALLFLVGAVFFTSTKRFAKTADVALFWIVVAATAGIFQALFPNAWNSLSPGLAFVSHKYTNWVSTGTGLATAVARAYGTLVDPAAMGLACAAGFILAAGALPRASARGVFWCLVAMLIAGLTLVFSGSRLSMAGLGAGLLTMALLSLRYKEMRRSALVAVTVALLAVPVGFHAGGRAAVGRFTQNSLDYAGMTRARSEAIVLASLPSHPFGLGLGATGAGGRVNNTRTNSVAVDNVYFATLYQSGVAGLVLFAALQATFLFLAVKNATKARTVTARALYITLASLQVALLVAGIWTQGAFNYAPVCQVFWLLSGALPLLKRVEGEPS